MNQGSVKMYALLVLITIVIAATLVFTKFYYLGLWK